MPYADQGGTGESIQPEDGCGEEGHRRSDGEIRYRIFPGRADLMERYDTVYFQDEMIASWHASHSYSSRVQHSFVGAVKALLMGIFSGTDGRRAFCIQRGFPTTKLCCTCGEMNSIGRFQKEFHCAYCGNEEGDRDVHAAGTIKKLGSAIRAQWLDEPCVEGDSSILGGVHPWRSSEGLPQGTRSPDEAKIIRNRRFLSGGSSSKTSQRA